MVSLLKILKALADENRLKIVELLLLHNPCVGAIAMHVGISEAAVSQHLKILKDVGLLDGERCGHFTHYRINQASLKELGESLAHFSNTERSSCMKKAGICPRKESPRRQARAEGAGLLPLFCQGTGKHKQISSKQG